MLGNRNTGTGNDEGRSSRDVYRTYPSTTCSARVHQILIPDLYLPHDSAQCLGGSDYLFCRFTFHPEPYQ
jgi:hypothetical protein